MVKVKISEKGGQQSNYEFDKPEVTIGRMKGNDIVLPKGNVSKKHARIYGRNGALMIDDLDSTNGTYVNGRKVTSEHEITENDKIYIGDFILQVRPERQQQQAGGPPQAPPSPPGGGGQGDPRNSQLGAGGGGGQSNMSPPSPPESGGGAAASGGAASGGGPSGGGDPLSSLDEKYGSNDGSGPSRSGGGSGGRPSQSNLGSPSQSNLGNASGLGANASGGSPAGPGSGPNDNRMNRSSTRRDRSVSGGQQGPDSSGSHGLRNQPGGSGGASPGRGGSAPSDRSGSAPKSSPGRRPGPDESASRAPRPSSGAGHEPQGRPGRSSGGAQPPRGRDRPGGNLRSDQRPEQPSGQPILPPELESEFDSDFQAAQEEVVEALFDEIALDDLPLAYPPDDADREHFQDIVRDTVQDVKPRRVDREMLIEVMTAECVALGPLEQYLDDPDVQNIYVNRFDQIVVRRDNDIILAEHAFSHPDFLQLAAWRLLGTNEPEIISDEIRFGDGTRIHVMLPPVTVDGPVLTIRKPPTSHPSLDDLVDDRVMSAGMCDFLERAVESGRSVLIAGPTSSGKTTLLEALGRSIPEGSRIIVVEETSQVELPQEGVVRLEANPGAGYDLEEVLEAAVGMHPEKILLDECRGGEAYTWVSSAASGTEGSVATIHGINADDALGRLESLCLLGSGDVSPRGLREQIARALDLVVVINRANDGSFRVQQITEVQGVDLDAFRLNDIFYYRMDGTTGAFHPTGYIPLFYEDLRHLGMDVDLDIFRE